MLRAVQRDACTMAIRSTTSRAVHSWRHSSEKIAVNRALIIGIVITDPFLSVTSKWAKWRTIIIGEGLLIGRKLLDEVIDLKNRTIGQRYCRVQVEKNFVYLSDSDFKIKKFESLSFLVRCDFTSFYYFHYFFQTTYFYLLQYYAYLIKISLHYYSSFQFSCIF